MKKYFYKYLEWFLFNFMAFVFVLFRLAFDEGLYPYLFSPSDILVSSEQFFFCVIGLLGGFVWNCLFCLFNVIWNISKKLFLPYIWLGKRKPSGGDQE